MNEKIKQIPIFENCIDTEVDNLALIMKEEFFSENKVIFQKGDNGNKMYFIFSGEVKIYDTSLGITKKIVQAFSLQKDEKEIAILKKGMFFGEMALISEDTRLFSARALSDSILFSISKDDLKNLIESNPETEKVIGEILVKRVIQNSI